MIILIFTVAGGNGIRGALLDEVMFKVKPQSMISNRARKSGRVEGELISRLS